MKNDKKKKNMNKKKLDELEECENAQDTCI